MSAKMKIDFQLIDKVTGPLQKIQGDVSGLSKKFNMLQKALPFAAFAGGAMMAYRSIKRLTDQAIQMGDRIHKASQRVGMSTKGFQSLERILDLNGTSMSKLERQFVRLGDESVNNAEKFKKFGINIHDSNDQLLSQDKIIMNTLYTLSDMEDKQERNSRLIDLMGQRSADLIPVLNNGKHAIKTWYEEAEQMGMVIENDVIEQLAGMKDTQAEAERQMKNLQANLAVALIPEIEYYAKAWGKWANALRKFMNPSDFEEIADWQDQLIEKQEKLDQISMKATVNPGSGFDKKRKELEQEIALLEMNIRTAEQKIKNEEKRKEIEEQEKIDEEQAKKRKERLEKLNEQLLKAQRHYQDVKNQSFKNAMHRELEILKTAHKRRIEEVKGNSELANDIREIYEKSYQEKKNQITEKYAEKYAEQNKKEEERQKAIQEAEKKRDLEFVEMKKEWEINQIRDKNERKFALEWLQHQQFYDRLREQYKNHTEEINKMDQKAAQKLLNQQEKTKDSEKDLTEKKLNDQMKITVSKLKDTFKMVAKENEEWFVFQKAIASGDVMVSGIKSAMNIFEGFSTMPIVGKALGLIEMASVMSMTALQVAKIQQQEVPRYASGGSFFAGEMGKELVSINQDRSARIYNNYETTRYENQNQTLTLNIIDQHGNITNQIEKDIRQNKGDNLVSLITDKVRKAL